MVEAKIGKMTQMMETMLIIRTTNNTNSKIKMMIIMITTMMVSRKMQNRTQLQTRLKTSKALNFIGII